MIFTSDSLNNRLIDLDDVLVEKNCEYDELRDAGFCIVIRSKYGHIPTEEECSREELSEICNEVLLSSLKAMALLPKALEIITESKEELSLAAKEGRLLERKL